MIEYSESESSNEMNRENNSVHDSHRHNQSNYQKESPYKIRRY